MPARIVSWSLLVATALTMSVIAAAPAIAQTKPAEKEAPPPDPLPPFPRINLAPWYEVDPDWPNKPDGFAWEAMSGIAVDQQDNVYIFTRSKPPRPSN